MSAGTLSICQQDSYRRSSRNRVISCSPSTISANEFDIVLEDSVLYPEGGGQPSDFGTVNGIEVKNVQKFEGENPGTFVKVTLPVAVEAGTEAESVVDWDRRYDHMQQHTAQHLLSGAAFKIFNADTVGWNLGVDYVTVDLALPGGGLLSDEQISVLESHINDEIRRGAAVSWVIKSRDELGSGTVSVSEVESEISIRGAPKGAALELESLRLVCIAGLDANPCGGTHIKSLSELQLLKVVGAEKDRDSCRLKFLAGGRTLAYFSASLARENALSQALSVPPKLFPATVDKIMTERRDNDKKMKEMQLELAALLGKSLADTFLATAEDKRVLTFHRHGVDVQFLLTLVDSVVAALDAGDPAKTPRFVFLSGDELSVAPEAAKKDKKKGNNNSSAGAAAAKSPIANPVPGTFVLVGPADKVAAVKDAVCTALGGRGGGKPGRLQGQASAISVESLEAVRQFLFEHIAK